MHSPGDATSPTLLSRVRDPGDTAAWEAFESRYRTLLVRFCQRQGLQHADAEDVAQAVLTGLVKSLPRFVYDPQRGRFRDYLYRIARHTLIAWRRRAARPPDGQVPLDSRVGDALADDEDGRPDTQAEHAWQEEWVAHHFRLAMQVVRETFEPQSVEVFNRSVRGEPLASVAATLGISEEAAKKARQRIKARLEELIARQVAEEDEAGDR
ncbi:MAG: RNA polymerase sigma factor [Phycisphaerales bacterium]